MNPIRLLAPTGNLGSGFSVESLRLAMSERPDIIAVDSGSTDGGPSYLGSAKPYFPPPMYRRDIRPLLLAAREAKIPLVIGSAAGAGTNAGVDLLASIVKEIAHEEGLNFRLATILSEQPRDYLHARLAEGRIKALGTSGPLAPERIDNAERVVGMMGCEPIIEALEGGADVIVAGRASDAALFAALPVSRGHDPGPAWHAGKILECGAAATVKRLVPDCMMAVLEDDHFTVHPLDPRMRCSTLSVAAHTLYENGNPYEMREPSGTLRTDGCIYTQIDGRSVRVTGSEFEEASDYTIKLEASESIGYQSVAIAGVRDPYVLAEFDAFLESVETRTAKKLSEVLRLAPNEYRLQMHVYGKNAVMGRLEPQSSSVGHEVGVLFDAVAPTQEDADTVIAMATYVALHNPVSRWTGMVTNLANGFSPPLMSRGPAYRFTMNHVVQPERTNENVEIHFSTH